MTDPTIICDRLGVPLAVGDTVLLLQVPIVGDHEFICGTVLTFGKKKVKIETTLKNRWGETRKTEVLRYPHQLIKKHH